MSILNRFFKDKKGKDKDTSRKRQKGKQEEEFEEEYDTEYDDEFEDFQDEEYEYEDEYEEVEETIYYDENDNPIPPEDLHLYDIDNAEEEYEDEDEYEDEEEEVEEDYIEEYTPPRKSNRGRNREYADDTEEDFELDMSEYAYDEDEYEEDDEFEEEEEIQISLPSQQRRNRREPIDLSVTESEYEDTEIEIVDDSRNELHNDNAHINFGDSGLLEGTKNNKEDIYKELRYQISDKDIEIIHEAVNQSSSVNEILAYIDEQDISLQYVIALDLVTEEDVSGYNAYKRRGLLDKEQTTIDEIHDTSYIHEIIKQKGIKLDEVLTDKSHTKIADISHLSTAQTYTKPLTYEEDIELNTPQDTVEKTISANEPIEETIETINEQPIPSSITGSEQNIVSNAEEVEVETLKSTETTGSGASFLSKIKSLTESSKGTSTENPITTTEDKEEPVIDIEDNLNESQVIEEEPPSTTGFTLPSTEKKENVEAVETFTLPKIVKPTTTITNTNKLNPHKQNKLLIICEGIVAPKKLGEYDVIVVEEKGDLNQILLSSDNILVVTPLIPTNLKSYVMTWLDSSNPSQNRVVTLTDGLKLTHSNIDTEIELNQESIAEYVEKFPKHIDRKQMGSQLDISKYLM